MEELTAKEDKIIEKEVKKRLSTRLYHKTKTSASKFKNEFKAQTVTAITAAFAFLIALSWREPIQLSVNSLITRLGLGAEIYAKYIAAAIVTIIAVVCLIFLSRWNSKEVGK